MGFFGKKKSKFLIEMQEKYSPIYSIEQILLKNRGLPAIINNYTYFDFLLCKDKIVILCDPYEIVIMKEDLKDMYTEDFRGGNVIKASNGSLVGSMVGESMFGTPGAIAGAVPRIQTSAGDSGTNMIIRYRSKDNVIKSLFFQHVSGIGHVKDEANMILFCRETYKELLGGEELQNGQIIL